MNMIYDKCDILYADREKKCDWKLFKCYLFSIKFK